MAVERIKLTRSKSGTDHFPAWLETFIIIVIILVIVQTILDDLALMLYWSPSTRDAIMIAGFVFDVFFTAEFIGRAIVTGRTTGFMNYIRYERGWVDGLSSVPLLLLVSGPAFILYLAPELGAEGGTLGFLSVLKTAKAIRVTRILRLVRVIKLFGKIQNTDSVMTGRQVGTISTIAVVSLVMVMMVIEFVPGLRIGGQDDYKAQRTAELVAMFGSPAEEQGRNQKPEEIKALLANPRHADVIYVEDREGKKVYEADNADVLKTTRYPGVIQLAGGMKVALSHHPADSEHARANLLFLIAILFVVGALMLLYTTIFARQVADPVFIMDRGLRDMGYNLEVKLDSHNKNDEVFRLASAYNVRWLPLKNQIIDYRKKTNPVEEKSVLSVTDIL